MLPSAWLVDEISPVPRKSDLKSAANYRGITLIPIAVKAYNKFLLNMIVPMLDPLLHKNQNGFRRGCSTTAQAFSIVEYWKK